MGKNKDIFLCQGNYHVQQPDSLSHLEVQVPNKNKSPAEEIVTEQGGGGKLLPRICFLGVESKHDDGRNSEGIIMARWQGVTQAASLVF